MEDKQSEAIRAIVTHCIESAALQPEKRFELLLRALEALRRAIPVLGTALIWPCRERKIPWKVLYSGPNSQSMYRWLSVRLRVSLDETINLLQHDCATLSDMPTPLFIRLQLPDLLQSGQSGGWMVWPSDLLSSGSLMQEMEHARYYLESLLEVEYKESLYFPGTFQPLDPQLIEALIHGDAQALPAMLSLARIVGKADLTYWGQVRHKDLEVAWSVGAERSDFGFELPLGEGIGGRAASLGAALDVTDYRNSPYRYPDVREMVDSERVRSGLVIPIHDTTSQTGGVLYLTRRTINPFSLAERLMALRLARTIEPLAEKSREVSFPVTRTGQYTEQKSAWRDIVLHASRIEVVEQWIAQVIKGPAMIVDDQGIPYRSIHAEHLEQLRATRKKNMHILPLTHATPSHGDQLYLWPSIPLPPTGWPDFLLDAVTACNVILARMEQARDQIRYQQEQWLRAVLESKSPEHLDRDGYRLGLLAERGEVWAVVWMSEMTQRLKAPRIRTAIENVVLEHVQSPLLFVAKEHLGVIFIRGHPQQKPAIVRDELLRYIGPSPVWIVHGASYASHSLPDLKTALLQTIALAQKARREEHERYVLNVHAFGLTGLLENPRLTQDLEAFAQGLLEPLIEYDARTNAELTRTFVLTHTLGSLQATARHLTLHINTVRYRVQQARRLLGKESFSPEEETALKLAAFIWLRHHTARVSQSHATGTGEQKGEKRA